MFLHKSQSHHLLVAEHLVAQPPGGESQQLPGAGAGRGHGELGGEHRVGIND